METIKIPGGEYVSLPGAMEALGVSKSRISQLVVRGRLNPIKVGPAHLYSLEELAEYRLQRLKSLREAADRAEGVGHDS